MKSTTLLKIAAIAVLSVFGLSRAVAQSDDIDYSKYETEGKLQIRLKSGFGQGVPLPAGVKSPTWFLCVLEAYVTAAGYHGDFIDLNNNHKYDVGEGIWSSANIAKKEMTEKEVTLYTRPGIRLLLVSSSGLTEVDLSQVETLTSLNLAMNSIKKLDISNMNGLNFLDLDAAGIEDIKLPSEKLPLSRFQFSKNSLDVHEMHRLIDALWNHAEGGGKPGTIWLGDMTDGDKVQIAKSSYELLKSKNWVATIYQSLEGISNGSDDPEDWELGEEYVDGSEEFSQWAEKHIVDDPQNLGVEAIAGSSLKAYPTVANTQVTVEAAHGEAQKLAMYDMSGALVATAELNGRATINVQDMPNGMYLIRVNNQTLRVQVAH
ncbi:MAG: T9SS type A sorting domain-containing protein [Porphyromonas sp.]|nr:T9SS type A sorting domain-containing protein [Porphyromonas sp.]